VKRIWVFGIFCIVLTLLFVSQNIFLQYQVALQGARSDSDALAQFLATDINSSLFSLNQVFLGVHNVVEISQDKNLPHAPSIRHALDQLKEDNSFFTTLLVLDDAGRIVHWTGTGEPPIVQDRKYFRVHKEEKDQGLFVSRPFPSRRFEGEYVFSVSKAYRSSNEALNHVIVAIVNLKYFQINYADLSLSSGNAVTLASPQGDIYMRRPGSKELPGKNIPQITDHLQDVDSGTFLRAVSPIDGAMRGISLRRVGTYPLFAAASYNEEIALAEWRKSATLVAAFGVAVIAIFFLLTLQVVRFQKNQVLSQEKLQLLAITDPLTRLANRRHAVETAEMEIKKAQRLETPLSFVLMDLDHFKKVNDTYGHEKGDLVLRKVAKILLQYCRQTDGISRFGGEEFLLILPGTDNVGAGIYSEKIRRALDEGNVECFEDAAHVTASFGVAQWRINETEFRETLRRADRALYQAKEKGRNCIQISPSVG
jgi:diguanylate cyclase (GGDEF)-like protein